MKILIITLKIFVLVLFCASCQKKASTADVDFSKYNNDDPQANAELDQWLKANFLDPYNINVTYRYDYYSQPPGELLAPAKMDSVKPVLLPMKEGFLDAYVTAGGDVFMKKYEPKFWTLFGTNYSDQVYGPVFATSSGGRMLTLFGVNNYNPEIGLTVVHRIFVKMLSQVIPMPTDFEPISAANYLSSRSISDSALKANGFVSLCASQDFESDFAETTAFLLLKGNSWYDNYVANLATTAAGKTALQAKKASVINYYITDLDVDFYGLQKAVQTYARSHNIYPVETGFAPYLSKLYKTITMDPGSGQYMQYGASTNFKNMYGLMADSVAKATPGVSTKLSNMQLRFLTDSTADIRLTYTQGASITPVFADYTFSYKLNTATGDINFTKKAQAGTSGSYANANTFMNAFTKVVQPYFTGSVFTAGWLKADLQILDYNSIGAFYEKGNAANYWYGILGQTLQ